MKDRQRFDRDTGGFAMPAAIFALVVLGVLVVGGFFTARQEGRIGIANERATEAFYIAETGAAEVLENWNATTYSGLSQFASTTVTGTTNGGDWSADVTKLSDLFFLIESQGTVTEGAAYGDATREVARLVKIRTFDLDFDAALATVGQLKFGGSAVIKGADTNPDGTGKTRAVWGSYCDGYLLEDKTGLLIDDLDNIDWSGNQTKIVGDMSGDPKYREEPGLNFDDMLNQWADLTGAADLVITSGTSGISPAPTLTGDGACNTADRNNWGAPLDTLSPCFGYFPIIHLNNPGTEWTLNSNGAGQGILLVEGDLRVNGGFEFYGPILIKGTLTTNGSGGHFWGGTIAANVDLGEGKVIGDAELQYSSCALGRAILGSSFNRPNFIAERSWIDVTGADSR